MKTGLAPVLLSDSGRRAIGNNKVAAAHERAKRLDLRRALIRWYEGQLIAARDGVEVVILRREHSRNDLVAVCGILGFKGLRFDIAGSATPWRLISHALQCNVTHY